MAAPPPSVDALTQEYGAMMKDLRAVYQSGRTRDLAWRRAQLQQLVKMISENTDAISEAVNADLGGGALRGVAECSAVNDARLALANLSSWAQERWVGGWVHKQYLRPEPKGVVLIIAPWNYPFLMCLQPLVPAIAAGNVVVIKPSELNERCSPLIAQLVAKYLDPECVRVIQGAVPETTALLNQQWNHIFYTGNGAVGRVVMTAAAKHLTPVTLELGGKSPVIIDSTACMNAAIGRCFLGKFLNAGQTCIAPDYVLVHESRSTEFVDGMKKQLQASFGKDPKSDPSWGKVIAERHVDRLKRLLETSGGTVVCGGVDSIDRSARFVPPTILLNPELDSPIMKEEIFGPVLVVRTFKEVDDAVRLVRSQEETPLAAYFFSQDRGTIEKLLVELPSGGVCVNSAFEHNMGEALPFGGQGASGMGSYHGKFGFEEFSHQRAVLQKSTLPLFQGAAFPLPKAGQVLPPAVMKVALRLLVHGFLPLGLSAHVQRLQGLVGDAARFVLVNLNPINYVVTPSRL